MAITIPYHYHDPQEDCPQQLTGHQKAFIAEDSTVGWNERGTHCHSAGTVAGSIALVGFGLDNYIEVASGVLI